MAEFSNLKDVPSELLIREFERRVKDMPDGIPAAGQVDEYDSNRYNNIRAEILRRMGK